MKKGAPSSSSNKNDKRAGSAGSASGGEPGWQGETYEVQRVAGVDDVFLGFVERVGREPGQLLRCVTWPLSDFREKQDKIERLTYVYFHDVQIRPFDNTSALLRHLIGLQDVVSFTLDDCGGIGHFYTLTFTTLLDLSRPNSV